MVAPNPLFRVDVFGKLPGTWHLIASTREFWRGRAAITFELEPDPTIAPGAFRSYYLFRRYSKAGAAAVEDSVASEERRIPGEPDALERTTHAGGRVYRVKWRCVHVDPKGEAAYLAVERSSAQEGGGIEILVRKTPVSAVRLRQLCEIAEKLPGYESGKQWLVPPPIVPTPIVRPTMPDQPLRASMAPAPVRPSVPVQQPAAAPEPPAEGSGDPPAEG